MEIDNKTSKIHPLLTTAAIALIVACVTGIAAMTGVLPNFSKNTPPVVATSTTGAEAPTPAPAPAPIKDDKPAPVPNAAEKPVPIAKAIPKKPKPIKTAVPAAPIYPDYRTSQAYAPPPPPRCRNCGIVESIQTIQQQASTSGVGAGVGALLGGVLGHQVGGGNGRTLATVAGAIGGGLAGNTVEKNTHTTTSYEVIVRMDDGDRQRFLMNEQRWRNGDLVRVDNGYLFARNQ